MNIIIPREALFNPLQAVIGVVERSQTIPILANVLLAIDGESLALTATDLGIELVARSALTQPQPALRITVQARKLLDICRTLPEACPLELQYEDNRLVLRAARCRFVLPTLPADDFPLFKWQSSAQEFMLEQKAFSTLLQRTHFAVAQQDARYYLNGLLLEHGASALRAVATDGHRFATHSLACTTQEADTSQVILPRKSVAELMRLLKQDGPGVQVSLGDNAVRVQHENFTFTSKLIDGRYPDYRRLLPKALGSSVTSERDVLREALQRVSALSSEKFCAVQLQLRADVLHLTARSMEQEEAEETLAVEYSGADIDMAFNVAYLLDVLNTVASGTVKLTFIDANSRLLVEAGGESDSLFIVMPVQL